ncbi:selenocysteine-specific translation elongation factor [Sporomusa malonica]|uniref:Selenocysteine-specific elongation factor n=1 Tax=Sporomusa malonica TaxID=112901 RepID=A0A1W2D2I5_9FIRM|nr:selenocysteine-specific translation elongation factor [Sporomusa malonica]SMC91680.1 selenocysteine-specific translation elongation factor SelB [Sporomusa malonica]
MKYIIIGTAGHVDHGKSAIIKALTGTDTDRLKEEKLRGISIDLGFASLPLGEQLVAGIVDVPGHERFLKNMLAGTGGIDLAMLVIAADEGVMPQTREHLAMLELYGIKHGLVIINKIDKADDEWLELVEGEIREFVSHTFLKDAPFCRVSAQTGAGIEELRKTMKELADTLPVRDSNAPFRLWIDRVFTIKGYGIVVTGSVLSGQIKVGDTCRLQPAGTIVRVRGLEWHGDKVNEVIAGQRAAINLAGLEMEEISRGMALSAVCRGEVSQIWDVVADWQQEIDSGVRVRLHLGTGEFLGRMYAFKEASHQTMRLILEQPLAAGAGDRGIIRLYSPQHLLGGITLIAPGRATRRLTSDRKGLAEAFTKSDQSAALYHRVAESRKLLTREEIRQQSGYLPEKTVDRMVNKLTTDKKLQCLDGVYLATVMFEKLTLTIKGMLKDYHKAQPERSGLSKEIARQKLALDEKSFEIILAEWLAGGVLITNGGELALKSHADKHGGWKQDIVDKASIALEDVGLASVDLTLLSQKLNLPPDKAKVTHDALVRAGVLVKVSDIFVYSKTIQYIVQLIHRYFKENETLTVAELRDILNTSRKIALPLMEYLDMHKYTVRDGDVRRPTRKVLDLSE